AAAAPVPAQTPEPESPVAAEAPVPAQEPEPEQRQPSDTVSQGEGTAESVSRAPASPSQPERWRRLVLRREPRPEKSDARGKRARKLIGLKIGASQLA